MQCVYQDKCIEILIKGFLKKFGRLQLLEELVDEISNLAKRIYINDDLDSAYDRVGRVQEFVHRKINKAHGDHAHLRLPVRGIRNLLSASRLHLNLVDIKKRDPLYLTYIIGKSEKQAYAECVNPRPFYPREGVQYKKNWRVRHIKPVSYYSSLLARKRMLAIRQIDNALPLEEFRERILLAYCELMPARC